MNSTRSSRTRFALAAALAALATASLAQGCGSDVTPNGQGGAGASSATTSSGSTTATTTSGGDTGGGGGAPAPECVTSNDCVADKKKPVCDTTTGTCVACLPDEDVCASGKYCSDQNTCEVGCNADDDCSDQTICDLASHACVGCLVDTDCPLGTVCFTPDGICEPGCSAIQKCPGSQTCCNDAVCNDLDSDIYACGSCDVKCPSVDQATAVCVGGQCGFSCDKGWADCDLDPTNGCEHNALEDEPCLCAPGSTQACYTGVPGTLNVGECKSGLRTCNPDGASWGPCVGQVLPKPEACNGKDDDCNGAPEAPGCVDCQAGTGSCNGNVGTSCPDGLHYVTEDCDPLLGLTCEAGTGKCIGACSVAELKTSYIGCDYYPTVTANIVSPTFNFAVAVSNTQGVNATITVSKGPNVIKTVQVGPNSVQIITLPWDLTLKGPSGNSITPLSGSMRVNQGAYRLRSTSPVSVYQFSPLEYQLNGTFSYTNDASILLPVNAWTGTYRVAARHHFSGGSGYYVVTAKEDNTVVKVSPGPTSGLVKSGVPGIDTTGNGQVTLNAGDVIQVVTNGGNANNDPNDVTGSLIKASKPVQVIGGHQCIFIPYTTGYCDHIEESMFPFETLSTAYIVTTPLINPGQPKVQMVRIVATAPNTTLTYDPPQPGAPPSIAQAGGWIEIANTSADFQITANNPILVVQYMTGQDAGGGAGDPAMSIAVAKDQYRKSYLFHAPTNYSSNYVNVTAPTGAVVTLDGQPVNNFAPIGGSGFSVARATLSNGGSGNHTISSSQPFGISVYGYGQYTSYWYPGGSEFVKLHD